MFPQPCRTVRRWLASQSSRRRTMEAFLLLPTKYPLPSQRCQSWAPLPIRTASLSTTWSSPSCPRTPETTRSTSIVSRCWIVRTAKEQLPFNTPFFVSKRRPASQQHPHRLRQLWLKPSRSKKPARSMFDRSGHNPPGQKNNVNLKRIRKCRSAYMYAIVYNSSWV